MIPFQVHRKIPLIRRPFDQRDLARLERDHAVAERDRVVAERDHAVAERDRVVAERDHTVAERDGLRASPAYPVVLNAPCLSPPSHHNAIDLFKGAWLRAMPEESVLSAGTRGIFHDDHVAWVANLVGGLAGKAVLDLGAWEGYEPYQFEELGVESVVSIEHMPVNFLKCLIVKNIFNLDTTFFLGDFIDYLEHTDKKFDLCWASGVLYHMTDPLRFLELTTRVSDRLFIRFHYFDLDVLSRRPDFELSFEPSRDRLVTFGGRQMTLHYHRYFGEQRQKQSGLFGGGNEAFSFWMDYPDIRFALEHLGFTHIIERSSDNPNGPGMSLLASRPERRLS
jgi:Protein of unknown function (DUF1698)